MSDQCRVWNGLQKCVQIMVGNLMRRISDTEKNIPLTPLRRSGRTLENNIKMDIKEMGRKDVDWTELSLYWS
jgi:hypothetical protein